VVTVRCAAFDGVEPAAFGRNGAKRGVINRSTVCLLKRVTSCVAPGMSTSVALPLKLVGAVDADLDT